ncbi:MAG: hypothetical protein PHO91_03845 [Patescibacteria group bacterium]|nr:hypothetical protein [Patescibacteria group bacterium]
MAIKLIINIFIITGAIAVFILWIINTFVQYQIAVITSIIASIIAMGVVRAIEYVKNQIFYSNIKKDYQGDYSVYWKYEYEGKKATAEKIFSVVINTKKNYLTLTGHDRKDNKEISGEIEISRTLPNYGKGYYYHSPDGWGFIEIQKRPENGFFAHQVYTPGRESTNQVTQAFTWIRNKGVKE